MEKHSSIGVEENHLTGHKTDNIITFLNNLLK